MYSVIMKKVPNERTKHTDVKCRMSIEKVKANQSELVNVDSCRNVAYLFT